MFCKRNQASTKRPGSPDVGIQVPVWVLWTAALLVSSCSGSPAPPDPPKSLFERIGGMAPLQRWVDDLAWRLAADSRIGDTFVRADFTKLKRQMLRMTCSITGGACEYDIDKLGEVHRRLSLTPEDIERFLAVARESASAVGLPEKERRELIERLRDLGPRLEHHGDRVGSDP